MFLLSNISRARSVSGFSSLTQYVAVMFCVGVLVALGYDTPLTGLVSFRKEAMPSVATYV